MRAQEPGDTFILNLNPHYHAHGQQEVNAGVGFKHAKLLRLRDFASMYGTVYGNMQMRRTGLWFVWNLAQMHDDIRSRVKEDGQKLVYGPRSDGRATAVADVSERGGFVLCAPTTHELRLTCPISDHGLLS